jgi:hypothetical protein
MGPRADVSIVIFSAHAQRSSRREQPKKKKKKHQNGDVYFNPVLPGVFLRRLGVRRRPHDDLLQPKRVDVLGEETHTRRQRRAATHRCVDVERERVNAFAFLLSILTFSFPSPLYVAPQASLFTRT